MSWFGKLTMVAKGCRLCYNMCGKIFDPGKRPFRFGTCLARHPAPVAETPLSLLSNRPWFWLITAIKETCSDERFDSGTRPLCLVACLPGIRHQWPICHPLPNNHFSYGSSRRLRSLLLLRCSRKGKRDMLLLLLLLQ